MQALSDFSNLIDERGTDDLPDINEEAEDENGD